MNKTKYTTIINNCLTKSRVEFLRSIHPNDLAEYVKHALKSGLNKTIAPQTQTTELDIKK